MFTGKRKGYYENLKITGFHGRLCIIGPCYQKTCRFCGRLLGCFRRIRPGKTLSCQTLFYGKGSRLPAYPVLKRALRVETELTLRTDPDKDSAGGGVASAIFKGRGLAFTKGARFFLPPFFFLWRTHGVQSGRRRRFPEVNAVTTDALHKCRAFAVLAAETY